MMLLTNFALMGVMLMVVLAAALVSGGPRVPLALQGRAVSALTGGRLSFLPPATSRANELMSRMAAIDRADRAPAAASARQDSRKRGQGHNGALERITLNLVPRASRALQTVSALTGDSKTDSINRAVQVYAYLEEINSRGGAVYVREDKDSELQLLKMF